MRRPLAAATAALLLVGTAACGSDADGGGSVSGVEVTGDVGEKPDVKVDDLDVSKTAVQTVVAGGGQEAAAGDAVLLDLVIVNGTTGKDAYSSFDARRPELVVLDDQKFLPELVPAVEGQKEGSRVVVTSAVAKAIGPAGATQIGLEKDQDVVFVIDLLAVQRDLGPAVEDVASGLPAVVQDDDGTVTGLDFSDADAKPSGKLQVVSLAEGDGPEVTKGANVIVDYYGAVYGRKKPFDESFSADPTSFPVGTGNLIKAWDQSLVGVRAGSRVLMVVPPALGYGAKGSPPKIPGAATLVFVVDVLGAAPPAAS